MKKIIYMHILIFTILVCILSIDKYMVKASSISLYGTEYVYYNDTDYKIGTQSETNVINNGNNALGKLVIECIEGEIINSLNNRYDVKSDKFSLSYRVDGYQYSKSEYEWKIKSDWEDDVDDMEFEKNIDNGMIIIRTSYDGNTWVLDDVISDVFKSGSMLGEKFYYGNNIQLLNGCYYQITIVYRQTKRLDDTNIAFFDTSDWQDRFVLERYEFYAENKDEIENEKKFEAENASSKNKVKLGKVIKVKKNSGYRLDQEEEIDRNDPHYGWELGSFIVKGFTSRKEERKEDVFFKNYGDRVRLYFNLEQDINALNKNKDLYIYEDNGGYDYNFQINRTNLKHGVLIVQHTDSQRNKTEPLIYVDFLEALTHTGSDTVIDLFEEGDYEVTLDYKIGEKGLVDTTYDYKINFKFKIRNGNCRAYALDSKSNKVLNDKDFVSSGFKIDLRESKYLECVIEYYTVNIQHIPYDNIRLEPKGPQVFTDGSMFKEPGKYVLTIKNPIAFDENQTIELYVGGDTEKDIYLKALSRNVYSLDEINKLLESGVIINEDGSIITPTPSPTPTPTPTPTPVPSPISINLDISEDLESSINDISLADETSGLPTSLPITSENDTEEDSDEEKTYKSNNIILIIVLLFVGIGLGIGIVLTYLYLKKKKEPKDEIKIENNIEENTDENKDNN